MKFSSAGMSFVRDRRGNIALMFGVILFVILGAGGVAIDLQRSNLVRTELQEASDAAILAAARYRSSHPDADNDELTAIARKVFDNAFKSDSSIDIAAFAVTFDPATETFALDLDGEMDALIMGVLGQDHIDIGARSEVRLGKPPLLEVAMALDVTGSMNDPSTKIAALKTSATDLIDSLFESAEAEVKVGVVPFAQYVNVGVQYESAGWIDAPVVWGGCVGSRNYPLNVQDTNYMASHAPGVAPSKCPVELLPLSDDEDEIKNVINGLQADGSTYIPGGLLWAWSLLTPDEPFTEGLTFEQLTAGKGTKALIVMTDGMNTKSPTYPLHDGTDTANADQLTTELCGNIKGEGIVVYSIAFEVTDPVIKQVLDDCATTPSHYFDAENSGALADAFEAIATSLRGLSLSK